MTCLTVAWHAIGRLEVGNQLQTCALTSLEMAFGISTYAPQVCEGRIARQIGCQGLVLLTHILPTAFREDHRASELQAEMDWIAF